MPINQAHESVSTHECSWADLAATINIPGGATFPVFDFESFKWGAKLARSYSMGLSGGRPRKRTRGEVAYEGSCSARRSGWMQFLEALEVAAESLGDTRDDRVVLSGVTFDLVLQHTPLGDTRIYSVKMSGCSLDGFSSDMKQGSEGDVIEIDCQPLEVASKSATGKWIVLA